MTLTWAPDISIIADTMNKAESFICIITSHWWPNFVIKLPFPCYCEYTISVNAGCPTNTFRGEVNYL